MANRMRKATLSWDAFIRIDFAPCWANRATGRVHWHSAKWISLDRRRCDSKKRQYTASTVCTTGAVHSIRDGRRLRLNGVANARILRETQFTTPYLQAAASDDGTCLGAAYYVWHQVLGREERFHMQHAFWGPGYSEERLRTVAEASGCMLKVCEDETELVETAAGLIAEGLVMGWYQGRSEWGPRALGNRSILANPAVADMKDTINTKIKRRESFRPFAPSVLKEDVAVYFEQIVESPFMMHVVKIRPEWRERLPAVTHVDGTGRLQTVDASEQSAVPPTDFGLQATHRNWHGAEHQFQ